MKHGDLIPKPQCVARTMALFNDRAFHEVETQEPDKCGFRVRVDPSLPPNRAVITSAGQRTAVNLIDRERQEKQC